MAGKRIGTVWAAIATALLVGLIFGCGGSGSSSGTTTTSGIAPTGNAAIRSSVIGSYQSLGAGVAFPFTSLLASAPAGSSLHKLAVARNLLRPTSGLTFVPELALYTDGGALSGNSLTYHYFTDAAGKDSAGTMVLTIPGGSTSYIKYPVTINVTVNVTGGNLPCTGSAVIVFAGTTGTNTLKGTLNLSRNSETVSVNMTLSSSLQVGGTMTITENNTTISAVSLNGNVGSNIAFNFTMAPQGYSGTGTINLLGLTMSLNFTNPSKASSSLNSSGEIVINFPDGTTETVQDPFTAVLLLSGTTNSTTTTTTTTTTSTTGTTSGTTYSSASIQGNPTLIDSVNESGQMVGQNSSSTWEYWASPTAAPKPINLGIAGTSSNVTVMAVNSKGHIAALGLVNDQLTVLYWTAYNAAPTQIPNNFATFGEADGSVAINDSDEIVASNISAVSEVWASPTSQPVSLPGGQVTGLSNNGVAAGFQAPGTGNGGPNPPCIVWKQTVPPSTPQTLSSYSGGTVSIGADGTAAEWVGDQLLVYSGPSYSKGIALSAAPGLRFSINQLEGVGPVGQVLGYVYNGEPVYAAVWNTPTSDPIDLNKAGAASNIVAIDFETSAGVLIGSTQVNAGAQGSYAVLTPK